MIYYNSNTINDWNFGDDNIIKVYKHGAVCYYKITSGDTPTPVQEPCFAVVDDITQYSDTEFEDVYDKATEKWYKLNNLNQYEEYGVYGSGRTITTYEGKLTIDGETSSRLPQGYTEVEYIRQNSNYNAYINTGVYLFDNTTNSYTVTTKLTSEFHSNLGCATIISAEVPASPYNGLGYRYKCSSTVDELEFFGGNPNYTSSVVDNGDGTRTVTFQSTGNTSWTSNAPLSLLCSFSDTSFTTPFRYSDATIYSSIIVKNGVTVRDFVPAKRDSDSVYGLYDLITDTFFTSPNSNNFSGGSAVTPSTTATCEFIYSGGSWVNVGEVSGSSKTSGFTIDDINNDVTVKSSISDGDYYVISYYKHNNPKEPQYMMSYQTSNNYLSNFSGYTGSNTITPSTIIDAAIWKFEATSSANTYYIKNIHNNLYWGYQTRVSTRSLNLVGESDSSKAIVKVGVANSATTVGFVELNVNGSRYTYEDGTVGGYALNQLNGYTYRMNWWNTGGWGSDGNSAYYLYKIEGGTIVYPVEYDEMQDPPDNVSFSSMAEAEAYECPWVGMHATIDGDKYVFSGDSQSGYEWVYNPSRLPVGYTEVEYIQNTGTSYLNTNFVPNQDTRVVCDMQNVTASNFPRLWGAGAWNSATGLMIDYDHNQFQVSWLGKTSWTNYSAYPTSTSYNRHTYDLNKNYVYIDETLVGSNTYTTRTASDPIGVFTYIGSGRPSSGSYWGQEHFKGKMYSFKVYDNGTLVRDLVPCIKDSDNTVGAYDIVNDVFYTVPTGYTTDKLIAGPQV